jgi:hypothetical protein
MRKRSGSWRAGLGALDRLGERVFDIDRRAQGTIDHGFTSPSNGQPEASAQIADHLCHLRIAEQGSP